MFFQESVTLASDPALAALVEKVDRLLHTLDRDAVLDPQVLASRLGEDCQKLEWLCEEYARHGALLSVDYLVCIACDALTRPPGGYCTSCTRPFDDSGRNHRCYTFSESSRAHAFAAPPVNSVQMPAVSPPQQVDVGILTVIGVELRAIMATFGIDDAVRIRERGNLYWRTSLNNRHSDDLSIVVHCVGEPGQQAASAAAARLITSFRPRAMILVGIAAGRRKKIRIGDVAIPRSVVDNTQKVAEAGDLSGRPKIPPLPQPMRQMLSSFNLDAPRWHDEFRRVLGMPPEIPAGEEETYATDVATAPTLHEVAIASDNILLRDPSVLESAASEIHQQIRIGEMEAAGFVAACEGEHPPIPWLVVRGVSDFGDAFKNDAFHRLASSAAASYVSEFLRQAFDRYLLADSGGAATVGVVSAK